LKKRKLLLHACCAPCAIYPIEEAKKDFLDVTTFFYNPNIHPKTEHDKRKNECEKFFNSEDIDMISPEYAASDYFTRITEDEDPPDRCRICWDIRMEKSAVFAKEKEFDLFTTTLLGSPYQNHEILKTICERLSKEKRIDFYYKDFRTGFKQAHRLARDKGIYCQRYCGCVFSIVERQKAGLKSK